MGYCRVMDNVGYSVVMHDMCDGRNGFLVGNRIVMDCGRNRNSLGMPTPVSTCIKVCIFMSNHLIFCPPMKILMAFITEIMYF